MVFEDALSSQEQSVLTQLSRKEASEDKGLLTELKLKRNCTESGNRDQLHGKDTEMLPKHARMESGKSKSLTRVGTSERCGNNHFLYKKKEPEKNKETEPTAQQGKGPSKR